MHHALFRVTGECDHFHTIVMSRSFSVVHTIHNHVIFGSARTRCGWILVCPPGVQAVSFLYDDVSDVGFRVSDSSQYESSRCWDHSCRLTCRSLSLLEVPVVVLYFRERLRSRSWHSVTRCGRMKLVVTTMVLCLWSPSETSGRETSFWIQYLNHWFLGKTTGCVWRMWSAQKYISGFDEQLRSVTEKDNPGLIKDEDQLWQEQRSVFEGRTAGGLCLHEAGTHYVDDKITDSDHYGGELETDYWSVDLIWRTRASLKCGIQKTMIWSFTMIDLQVHHQCHIRQLWRRKKLQWRRFSHDITRFGTDHIDPYFYTDDHYWKYKIFIWYIYIYIYIYIFFFLFTTWVAYFEELKISNYNIRRMKRSRTIWKSFWLMIMKDHFSWSWFWISR